MTCSVTASSQACFRFAENLLIWLLLRVLGAIREVQPNFTRKKLPIPHSAPTY